MELKDLIQKLIEEKIDKTEYFMVDMKVLPANRIEVYLDGDNGINIDKCAEINKYIRRNIDQNTVDNYSITVSSPGLDTPLKVMRQYKKNIGKKVRISFPDGEYKEGKLINANTEKIVIEETTELRDGKTDKENTEITFNEISKTKVLLPF